MSAKHRKRATSKARQTVRRGEAGKGSQGEKKRYSAPKTSNKEGAERADMRAVRRWRLWVFRGAAVLVVPVLFLILVEVGLRVAGYGHPAHAIIKVKVDGKSYYCDNVKFNWRFFPRNISRGFTPFIFPAKKGEDAYRIFILGASAARGTPDDAFSFGRILDVMLADAYPGVDFEVVTVAAAAINSHVVLQIAKDCARCVPDLFVVYLGNNEVTGPYGAGTVFVPLSGNLRLIRGGIAFKGTRLGQLLGGVLGSGKGGQDVWRGLEMFLGKQVRADDANLQSVYSHFQDNLKDIVGAGRRGGAEVILCTVASNLKDNPPFGSLHRSNLGDTEKGKWDELYEQAIERETAQKYGEGAELFLAAGRIDDSYADLAFRLGRCYWWMGQYDKARASYIKALELDTLRFRADNRINGIIREVASGDGVRLADAVEVFAQNSSQGTAGEELFYEHVHFNFKGCYLLAGSVLNEVENVLPAWIKAMRKGGCAVASDGQCAKRLAFTDWDRYKVAEEVLNGFIKKPPFTNQLYHKSSVERLERDVEALRASLTTGSLEKAAEQYRQAIERRKDDWLLHYKYGKLLAEDLKNYSAAGEEYRIVQSFLPHSWIGYNALGSVLHAQGDVDGAIIQYKKAIAINPACDPAHYRLGWAYRTKGDLAKAEGHFKELARLRPDSVPAYENLATIYKDQDKLDAAVEILRKGLVHCPDSLVLHVNLGSLYNRQGRRDEAVREFERALELDPNLSPIRGALESLLKTRQ
ncbi:MAG: tetratricopeptide repeat protein [Sedimentisphaerales bacterium]|nr:tetratricopeptide repeat protein [Sedimentisphaerales bacterium]